MSECDVFGRTCFLNVVNNVTHSEVNLCPQCMKSCQYLHFHIVSVKSAPLADDVGMGGMSRYFKYFGDYCFRKDFCIYHLDKNRTFTPLSPAEQMMTKSTKLTDFGSLDRKHKGMIVVNIRFAKPEVDVMTLGNFYHCHIEIPTNEFSLICLSKDARLSVYDQIAGLGGTFGLYTQITGASLLTLTHLLVLIIKSLYNHIRFHNQN